MTFLIIHWPNFVYWLDGPRDRHGGQSDKRICFFVRLCLRWSLPHSVRVVSVLVCDSAGAVALLTQHSGQHGERRFPSPRKIRRKQPENVARSSEGLVCNFNFVI